MKRSGILNPALGQLLLSTGHTDYFTICDAGFPVPTGPERIDLALVSGIPSVVDVLAGVHAEWSIDRVVITQEMIEISPDHLTAIRSVIGDIPLEIVSHLELKRLASTARATVRTGDAAAYANIILVSG